MPGEQRGRDDAAWRLLIHGDAERGRQCRGFRAVLDSLRVTMIEGPGRQRLKPDCGHTNCKRRMVPGGVARTCPVTRAEFPAPFQRSPFFVWSLKEHDGANPSLVGPSFGIWTNFRLPAEGLEVSRDSESAPPVHRPGGPVHQGARVPHAWIGVGLSDFGSPEAGLQVAMASSISLVADSDRKTVGAWTP